MLRHGVVRVFVSFCVLVFVHFVMVPLNLTYLQCLQQQSFFEHLFNLYYKKYPIKRY